jgi:translation initiation factor 5A
MDDSTGDIREDIKIPDGDIGKEIQSKHDNGDNFMVTIVSAMGEEAAIATKAITK